MIAFEELGKVLFIGDMEPVVQRESFNQFEGEKLLSGLKDIVQAEVISLHSLEREAVIQFFWEGLSIEEIGKKMKLTKNSVKKLLDIGLSHIKARLVGGGLAGECQPI